MTDPTPAPAPAPVEDPATALDNTTDDLCDLTGRLGRQVEAVLADRSALAARVAELEGEVERLADTLRAASRSESWAYDQLANPRAALAGGGADWLGLPEPTFWQRDGYSTPRLTVVWERKAADDAGRWFSAWFKEKRRAREAAEEAAARVAPPADDDAEARVLHAAVMGYPEADAQRAWDNLAEGHRATWRNGLAAARAARPTPTEDGDRG